MTARPRSWTAALVLAPLLCSAAPASDSLYQMKLSLLDQSGKRTSFDRYRGSPVLVSMFYTSCDSVCPTLISSLKRLEIGLEAAARRRLRVLLISLDPERDTPLALSALAAKHGVDLARWSLTRPESSEVRMIASVFGVQYAELANGGFSHSAAILLLDPEGRLLARSTAVGRPDSALVASLRRATAVAPE